MNSTTLPEERSTTAFRDVARGGDWSQPTANALGVIPIPLALFALAAVAASTIDEPVARARLFTRLADPLITVLDRIETFGHGVGVGMILTAVFLLDPARQRQVPRLIACCLGSGMAANLVKLTVARLRPWAWVNQNGDAAPNQFIEWFPLGTNRGFEQSFPSAHTATAIGLALGLSALYPRGRYLFMATACLVGLQRAIYCDHFASDVLAGAGLAWIVVLAVFHLGWVERQFRRLERSAVIERPETKISHAA